MAPSWPHSQSWDWDWAVHGCPSPGASSIPRQEGGEDEEGAD